MKDTGSKRRRSPRSGRSERHASEDSDRSWDEEDAAIEAALEDERRLVEPYWRHTRLEDGAVITVEFIDADDGHVPGGAPKWFAHCRILEAEDESKIGLPIIRSYNTPKRGWISHRHNLAMDWRAITGLPMIPVPKSSPRVVLGMFLRGCQVEAVTHLVTRYQDSKERKWIDHPDPYSVIDRFVRVVNGTPRYVQRRSKSSSCSQEPQPE